MTVTGAGSFIAFHKLRILPSLNLTATKYRSTHKVYFSHLEAVRETNTRTKALAVEARY